MESDTNSILSNRRKGSGGVIFRRTLLICIIVLLLANVFLLAAYSYFGKRTYIELEMESLDSVVSSVQQLYSARDRFFVDKSIFADALPMLTNTADVRFYYFYYEGPTIQFVTNIDAFDSEYIQSVQFEILAGKTVRNTRLRLSNDVSAISIGLPLYTANNTPDGGILVVRDIMHIDKAFDRLNAALWIMAACVLPLMLLVAYIAAHNASKPIAEMTNVAIEVTKGNYGVHANEFLSGEIGIFARAMNRMSDTLSQTIHQLDSEKRQLGYILSSFSDGVAALDNLGNLTHYNPALMRIFGAVDVKYPIDLVPDKMVWETFQSVLDTKEPRTLHYELSGDRTLWISIVPVMADNETCTGVVGLFKDTTEIENLERMRRDYVANISHELRTPLTAVKGLLEPLSDGLIDEPETRQRYYDIMLHEVERLSRLISDMLQLSQLQSGTEYMERSIFDINELLEDVLNSYANTAEKQNIQLSLETQQLPSVISDQDRIEQVLVILIDNAIRYAGAGKSITLKTRQDAADVFVCVEDNGCGISQEDMQHIFERFYKASKARNEGGTGLGLSIAKQIMDKLGESLCVESELGKWTRFTFSVKKYVSNAIPLGPIDSDAIILHDMSDRQPDAPAKSDDRYFAPYEVIEQEKSKPARKHR